MKWRRLFAVTIYLYVRAGELEALRWSDMDLERGIVNINRGIDRYRRKEKSTKGKLSRRFPIEPNLLPLLRTMAQGTQAEGRVIGMRGLKNLARRFRDFLKLAGLTRAELFADDATRKPITFHDLRATGITWMAVRGDDALKIQSRAGHATFDVTQKYIREAEQLSGGFEAVFPTLPPCLLGEGAIVEYRQEISEVPETATEGLVSMRPT